MSPVGEYFCFRHPKHQGHNLAYLFQKLKIPKNEWKGLKLNPEYVRTYTKDEKDYSLWASFTPATESQEALDYLRSRHFLDPEGAVKKFNLRVAFEGEWAGRLLIPLSTGWTGRAMRPHLEDLRYKAHTNEDGFYFYGYQSSSAIVNEGALDAMRVASVSNQFDVFGRCGKRTSSALILALKGRRYQSLYIVPDNDVSFSEVRESYMTLKSYFSCINVKISRVPEGKKDTGDLSESETRAWLATTSFT